MYGAVFVEVCWVTQARLGEGSGLGELIRGRIVGLATPLSTSSGNRGLQTPVAQGWAASACHSVASATNVLHTDFLEPKSRCSS